MSNFLQYTFVKFIEKTIKNSTLTSNKDADNIPPGDKVMRVTIEMKDKVYVKLTPNGLDILKKHCTEKQSGVAYEHNKGHRAETPNDYHVGNGVYAFELIHLMYIFGGLALELYPFIFENKEIYSEPPW